MKKSVFTFIAVLVFGTTTINAQRSGGNRQNNGSRVENIQRGRGSREVVSGTRYNGGGRIVAPRREVIVETGRRPCPPAPVRVVHHPVRPVHVVHRPAPVYVEPVYVAPAPPPVVVSNSTAAGIVAGAITVTALAALLAN